MNVGTGLAVDGDGHALADGVGDRLDPGRVAPDGRAAKLQRPAVPELGHRRRAGLVGRRLRVGRAGRPVAGELNAAVLGDVALQERQDIFLGEMPCPRC